MALKHYDITIGASATPVTSTAATRKGVLQATIQNTTQNNSIYVGDSSVTATSYGHKLAADESVTLGPFSGASYLSTAELYVAGTAAEVVHILIVTH